MTENTDALYAVDDVTHKQNVIKAAAKIKEMLPNIEVKPVFVRRNGSERVVEEL